MMILLIIILYLQILFFYYNIKKNKYKNCCLKTNKKYNKIIKQNKVLQKQFNNFFIMVNGKRLTCFKCVFTDKRGCLKVEKNNIIIFINLNNNKIIIINNTDKKIRVDVICVINFSKCKLISNGIKVNNKIYKFFTKSNVTIKNKNAKIIANLHILNCRTKIIKFTLFNYSFNTMHSMIKSLYKGVINCKNYNVDFVNNIVKINKYIKYDNIIRNTYNVQKFKNYYLVNNNYVIKYYGNSTFIYKVGCSNFYKKFNSNFNKFFNVKIKTTNSNFNKFFNDSLINLVVSQCVKNYDFTTVNFKSYIIHFNNKLSFYYQLNKLKTNENYFNLYFFIMENLLGIKQYNNQFVIFQKPKIYFKKIIVYIFNNKLILKNYNGVFSIVYNDIEYKNIQIIKFLNQNKSLIEINQKIC